MTRWEYIIKTTENRNSIRALKDDGTWEAVPIDIYLNERGKQGWEVVSVVRLDSEELSIFFKRERSEL